MELENIFKKLKKIQPNEMYSRNSRAVILGTLPPEELETRTVWGILSHSFQYGTTVALGVVFLLIILGGFSTWRFLSPIADTNIDQVGMRAEAQVIESQLHLAEIQYTTDEQPAKASSVPVTPEQAATAKQQAEDNARQMGLVASSSDEVSIDDVLAELAK